MKYVFSCLGLMVLLSACGQEGYVDNHQQGTSGQFIIPTHESPRGFYQGHAKWSDWFAVDNREVVAVGDFNGDSKDDIISFLRAIHQNEGQGDVWVSLSNGVSFGGGSKWHDWFAADNREIPLVGDFNGDGKDDIVTFLRSIHQGDGRGDVWVALSSGSHFHNGQKWHDWFCIDHEIPGVGDFDGDGKDDIVTFKTQEHKVFVALSQGYRFEPVGRLWSSDFGWDGHIPGVGDFNGDGLSDIVSFDPASGKVYVALSNGSGFNEARLWTDFPFVQGNEFPLVADIDKDGRDDIITFVRDTKSGLHQDDVYAALSSGSRFLQPFKIHESFGVPYERLRMGDFTGDGYPDMAGFVGQNFSDGRIGDVYVSENDRSISSVNQIPVPISPRDWVHVSSPSVELHWTSVVGADYYLVSILTKNGNQWERYVIDNINGNNGDFVAYQNRLTIQLYLEREYAWLVRPVSSMHIGGYSEWAHFIKINHAVSDRPNLVFPIGGYHTGSKMEFDWQPLSGAHQYELYIEYWQVDNQGSGSWQWYYSYRSTGTKFNVWLSKSTWYRWQVRSIGVDGVFGPWSDNMPGTQFHFTRI